MQARRTYSRLRLSLEESGGGGGGGGGGSGANYGAKSSNAHITDSPLKRTREPTTKAYLFGEQKSTNTHLLESLSAKPRGNNVLGNIDSNKPD